MHAIFFGLKRAWHGCLRITRRPLTELGLTAARFDLLYVLRSGQQTTQQQLRLTLGVNRTTISRMLGSLEILGLVAREPGYGDRRTRLVRLTKQGVRCIRIAIGNLIDSGMAQLQVDTAIAGAPSRRPGTSWDDDWACLESTTILESFLRGMRGAYGDTAILYYPWHPDD